MERVWVGERLAASVRRIDFLDPAAADEPDARERGVRVEITTVRVQRRGSVYAAEVTVLEQALCRLDFLESGPGRADRMHWHSQMSAGEPGERAFDPAMPSDPRAWLLDFLRHGLGEHLVATGHDPAAYTGDLAQLAASAEEIGRVLDDGLAWAREPWPDVRHDERGMAVSEPR